MGTMISVESVAKTYDSGLVALNDVSLQIEEGEILALLGPNGAGKTTLISIICGITNLSAGRVTVGGHDVVHDYRAARRMIGLVPQEIALEPFERVWNTVRLSRGLFGLPSDDAYLQDVLQKLSLWDKRGAQVLELSGGMKRRVLIAKALSHAPRVLFLDEPTAGVDVELRKDMWEIVRELKAQGVTIILTTHYIEEAEAIADRVGVINRGEILLVEETQALMRRMGQKEMVIELQAPVDAIPEALGKYNLALGDDPCRLVYSYVTQAGRRPGITALLSDISAAGLVLRDVQTRQSSLEDIFVDLVREPAA
ncbi:MAG: ABC transporter ATP-binding protein [Rhodobacter sp.]|nr:ABC transporter ATP-binding protein [Rhodobacter sp.]